MEYPKGGLIGRTMRAVRQISDLNIPLHAANTGFFLVLSFFPALVLLLSLLRYARLDVRDLIGLVQGMIPQALLPEAEYLILTTYQGTSKTLVGISAATALWSASRGIWGLVKGLNAVYGARESRGWLYTRCLSALYTLAFLAVLILTLVLHVFGTRIAENFRQSQVNVMRLLTGVVDLRFVLLTGLQTLLFSAMYKALPSCSVSWRGSIPGAVLASLGWSVFSQGFSWYVERFSGYQNIYGSVYAVSLSMLWLYFCILILFYGALLNRILSERGE